MNEKRPLVSVVMITYNHEAFIKQAIEGVLMQEVTFDVELIIADDASPDETESIVQSFKGHPKYSWINYTRHRKNKGMVSNFIWALQQSQGKYIALCEGDDYWHHPLKLKFQFDLAENYSLNGVFTKNLQTFDGKRLISHYKCPSTLVSDTGKVNLHCLETQNWFIGHTSTYFFKSKIAQYFINDTIVGEIAGPNNLLYFHITKCNNVGFIDLYTSVYRQHPGGVTKQNVDDNTKCAHLLNRYRMYKLLSQRKSVLSKHLKYKANEMLIQLLPYFKHESFWKKVRAVTFFILKRDKKNLKIAIKKFKQLIKKTLLESSAKNRSGSND